MWSMLLQPRRKCSSDPMVEPRRGELWWVDWSPVRGSEQSGRRPALVLQTDAANVNPRYPNTIVLAVSTRGREVPTHVRLEPTPTNGLAATSYVKAEQILTVSKARLDQKIGCLDEVTMARVAGAVRLTLDIQPAGSVESGEGRPGAG